MDDDTRSIGAIAQQSGLSISALRFYDSAGVLPAAQVDAVTGYRRYTPDQVAQARLIAALRRVGMPLSEIREVLTVRRDPDTANRLLDRHLRRLEDGLTDARRELGAARALLNHQEKPMTTMSVLGADLTAALAAVRFAVSVDPELPALGGVLFHYDGATLRLVATDRYRLAVAGVAVQNQSGPAVQAIAPLSLVDGLSFPLDAELPLVLESTSVSISAATAPAIDAVFPDYERSLRSVSDRQVTITSADLRDRLTSGPTRTMTQAPHNLPHEISVVRLTGNTVDVLEHGHPDAVGFNRSFLLEAIDAGGADQLVLALDGPIAPLAILNPDRRDDLSLLMPTRLADETDTAAHSRR